MALPGRAWLKMTILKPRRLRRGDVIGLVAPASPPRDRNRIEGGVRYLERMGYRVKLGRHIEARFGYLAGRDEERAADLNAMLRDPEVRAIFALRGGYGTPRLLPHVDYGAFRRDPKILVGYSDITALQLAVFRRAGVVTFSGPMPGADFWQKPDPFTEEQFWRMVTSTRPIGRLPKGPGEALIVRRGGRVEGFLLGGNLALLTSNLGTRYSPAYRGSLLVLEDVGEHLHRVDRMFAQLRNAGVLRDVAGLVVGHFTECRPVAPAEPHLSLGEILAQVAEWVDGPMVEGLSYGHIPRKLTLPWGVSARLDAVRGRLDILEGAVI